MHADTLSGRAALAQAFALQQSGRLDEAEAAYANVLASDPANAAALTNAGALALARSDVAVAVARFQRATELAPKQAFAYNNLGFALIRAGRDAEALAELERAVTLQPDYAQAHNNRGIALVRLARRAEAIQAFERALAIEPSYTEAAINLGEQANRDGQPARAAAAFDRALVCQPENIHAKTGRAFSLALTGDLAQARRSLERVVATHPNAANAWQALGAVLNWTWQHEAAEAAFRRVVELDTGNADAQFGIASTLLARGQFDDGWAAFERRPDAGRDRGIAFAQIPAWDGSFLEGTLVVYGEQGFGDVVQFARFLKAARDRVGGLLLLLDNYHAPLGPLLAQAAGVDRVINNCQALPTATVAARASLMSLPHRLRITGESIRGTPRYLSPPADRRASWRPRLAPLGRPRVGIAWSVFARDDQRFVTQHKSVPAEILMPLVAMREASFVTLQPGAAGDPSPFASRVFDVRAELADFGDTAALIDELDLIITADTAVAHIAGALGKPVWMLDRFNTCWRWRLAADTSPWYPTLRIFRQDRFGDWSGPAKRLREAFAAWVAAPRPE